MGGAMALPLVELGEDLVQRCGLAVVQIRRGPGDAAQRRRVEAIADVAVDLRADIVRDSIAERGTLVTRAALRLAFEEQLAASAGGALRGGRRQRPQGRERAQVFGEIA